MTVCDQWDELVMCNHIILCCVCAYLEAVVAMSTAASPGGCRWNGWQCWLEAEGTGYNPEEKKTKTKDGLALSDQTVSGTLEPKKPYFGINMVLKFTLALTIFDLKMSSRPDRWLYWLGTLRRWTISKSVRTPGPWHSPAYTRLHFCWICTNMGTWLSAQEKEEQALLWRIQCVLSLGYLYCMYVSDRSIRYKKYKQLDNQTGWK